MFTVALAGNPNCGKTTLFNELTGSNQYVGNWAGVTVQKKEGIASAQGEHFSIVDLPGVYSLSPYTIEEICTRDYILDGAPDVIINIIDGANIERNLYLTLQLLELGTPLVLAVNMMDEVQAKGWSIRCEQLAALLGVAVVPVVARKRVGIAPLMGAVLRTAHAKQPPQAQQYDEPTRKALHAMRKIVLESAGSSDKQAVFCAACLLEADKTMAARLGVTKNQRERAEQVVRRYETAYAHGDRDTLLADARYRQIGNVVDAAVTKSTAMMRTRQSDKIDRVLTNRVLALPLFFGMMALIFTVVFGPVGASLRTGTERLVALAATSALQLLQGAGASVWACSLVVDAVIGGVGGVLTFLPQMALLFLFLSLLEDSGYMARAAFIMDQPLRGLGLTGKSFIPMLMGFGCTTPAVMAARALGSEKDRRLTIMLTPLMSCGARMPIYALFAGVFFTEHQGLVVFSLYLLGIVVAVVMGLILKNTVFGDATTPFVMELPAYRMPTLKSTLLHLWDKCAGFVVKAGTVIFLMSILAWLLQNFTFSLRFTADSSSSMLGKIGSAIAPLLAPLGFGTWQAAAALLAGVVAKEAVVSTMGVLYGTAALGAEVAARFTPLSAYAFMAFSLLYMPCVAAFAAIRREMNSLRWALATAALHTAVAYGVALLVYQVGGRMGLG